MEVVEELKSSEKMLALRAAAMHVPFAGTFELTPVCNMNCRMCYIHTSPKTMESQGRILTAEEWIKIASEARDNGLLYLLLTGAAAVCSPCFTFKLLRGGRFLAPRLFCEERGACHGHLF